MTKENKKKKEKSNVWKNIKYTLSTIHHYEKGFLFVNIIGIITGSILGFIAPLVLKIIIDDFSSVAEITKDVLFNTLTKVGIILLIAFVLDSISSWISNTTWYRVIRVRSKVIIDLNEKVLNLDYQTLENPEMKDQVEKAGTALGSNWAGFEGMYNYSKTIAINIVSTIVASAIIFNAHFSIIIIIIGIVVVKYFLRDYTNKQNKKKFWDVAPPYRRKLSYVNSISNNFSIAKDLRLYKMRDFIEDEQVKVQKDLHQLLRGSERRQMILEVLLTILDILQQLALYAILIYQVLNNNITVGSFTLMLSSVITLSLSISSLFYNYADLNYCSRQVNDLRKVMNYNDEYSSNTKKVEEANEYTLEFRNVYYKYYKAEDYTLKNISFVLHPKEKLALVGYNGAGKTTLIKLMLGLYHPTEGEILLNGENIEQYERGSLYKVFAPVFQDVNCFNFNIGENVAMKFGNEVDYDEAYNAIILAGLEQKINSLPEGIKTILLKELDEKGIELSGGELQKLALARAIYKHSKILILDEPTSALDALAEYKMYNNFNDMVKDASAIYISHRLSSTHFCDRIILLNKGEIAEIGTHEELMNNKKEYYDLFTLQAKYYQKEENNED